MDKPTDIAGAEIIARYMHKTVTDETDPDLVALREYFAIVARIAGRLRGTTPQDSDSRDSASQGTIGHITNNNEI